jgi:hypothetical protein
VVPPAEGFVDCGQDEGRAATLERMAGDQGSQQWTTSWINLHCPSVALPISGVAHQWRCPSVALPISGVARQWHGPQRHDSFNQHMPSQPAKKLGAGSGHLTTCVVGGGNHSPFL